MNGDPSVVDTLLDFYHRVSTGDVASFDRLVSEDPATLVIGTAPGEWVTDRARLRYGFEAEGLGISAGPRPRGHSRGDMGWVTDEPTYRFPDGSRMRTRLTGILHRDRDRDGWLIVHLHVSVGVPDDEVLDLQARWGTAP